MRIAAYAIAAGVVFYDHSFSGSNNVAMVYLWEDQVQTLREKIKDTALVFGLNTVRMVIVTLQGVTQTHLTKILLIIAKKQRCVSEFYSIPARKALLKKSSKGSFFTFKNFENKLARKTYFCMLYLCHIDFI